MSKLNKRFIFAIVSIIFVGLIAVVAVFFVWQSRRLSTGKTIEEVFAAMYSANSSRRENTSADATTSPLAADLKLFAPQPDKTLTTYKSSTQAGPKASSCPGYVQYNLNSTNSESYSYYRENETVLSKYVVRSGDGQIYNYSLTDKDYTYEYNGGKFAIRMPVGKIGLLATREATAIDVPNDGSTTETPNTFKVEDYFGADAKILGEDTINDKKYYIASWSYEGFCGEGKSGNRIVTKNWVNQETFLYEKEEIYLESELPENLIVTNTSSSETTLKEPGEVTSLFRFEPNVPVREIDPNSNQPGSASYTAAVKTLLATQKTSVLVPSEEGFKLDSYYSSKLDLPDPYSYRLERDFYPDTPQGNQLFQEAINVNDENTGKEPYLSINFSKNEVNSYASFSYEIYDNTLTDADIKNRIDPDNLYKNETVKISFAGGQLDALLYELSERSVPEKPATDPAVSTDPNSASGSSGSPGTQVAPDICVDCINVSSYTLTFTANNNKYVLHISGSYTKEEAAAFAFTILNAGSTTELEAIMALLATVEQVQPPIAL